MKKLLITLCVTTAIAIAANAGETKKEGAGKKHQQLTEEQKTARKALLEKYDTNKDGKLDKEERTKVSTEDKEKLEKAGLARKKKGVDKN